MSQSLNISQGNNQAQFIIENNSDESIPILISAHERIQNADGSEEIPDTNLLSIFPPQVIIPANQRRTIRVQWLGETPQKELPFRIIAEQVPLDVDEQNDLQQGIKMLLRYKAAFYVNPGRTHSKIQATLSEIKEESLSITVENTGTAHQILKNPRLRFEKDDLQYTYLANQLEQIDGQNVLPGSTRTFHIKKDHPITEQFKVTLRFD